MRIGNCSEGGLLSLLYSGFFGCASVIELLFAREMVTLSVFLSAVPKAWRKNSYLRI